MLGFYSGDASHDGSTDIGQVNVGAYSLGSATFNRKTGTATLIANAPGPGTVTPRRATARRPRQCRPRRPDRSRC